MSDYWIDPRRWATLVRAYALFLVIATVAEYNNIWQVVLQAWLPTPTEARDGGVLLQPMKAGIFLLPLLGSQVLTAAWLLLVRSRKPRADERAFQIARDLLSDIEKLHWGYRCPRILIGAVAQPHLVSVLGKPFLVLPRQGLAFFEHQVGADAELAFRAIIAHELGHLESWDDLLYLPWFCYMGAGFCFCLSGAYLSIIGRLAFSSILNHILILAGLVVLGFYVVRRREAYSDSFSVVTLGSVRATERALLALGNESKNSQKWDTHFDVSTRLALLGERGRPFLDMSRVDLGVAAFIYFSLRTNPLSSLSSGGGPFWALTLWLDDIAIFSMTLLLLLMIGGLSLARGGKPVGYLEVGIAGALCLISHQVSSFLGMGAFNFFQVLMFAFSLVLLLPIALVPFVLIFRVLNLWGVAILGRPGGNARERLFWGALVIVASFTVLEMLSGLGMALATRRMAGQGLESMMAVLNSPSKDQVLFMLPLFLIVATLWLSKIGLGIVISAWSWRKSRSLPNVVCPLCAHVSRAAEKPRLIVSCPSCGSILRPDLVYKLASETT